MRSRLLYSLFFTAAVSFAALSALPVSAQVAEPDAELSDGPLQTPSVEVPKTRYYLGTNLMNLPIMGTNIGFQVRFPDNFALQTSLFAWAPWILNSYYLNPHPTELAQVVGLRIEPRWYLGRRKQFYVGFSAHFAALLELGQRYRHSGDPWDDVIDPSRYYGPLRLEDYELFFGVNAVVGYFARVTPRFGIDLNIGVGPLGWWRRSYFSPNGKVELVSIPGCQGGVSLVWELGHDPMPLTPKIPKQRRRQGD